MRRFNVTYVCRSIGILCGLGAWAIGMPSQAQVPTERNLLWEISGKDLTKPSFLYGTTQIACDKEISPSAVFKQKFNSTQQLYLEFDFDDPNMIKESMESLFLRTGKPLRSYFKPKDYETIDYFFIKSGLPLGLPLRNTNFKPLALQFFGMQSLMGCPVGSWEFTLVQLAQEQNMQIEGLETVKEQTALIDKIPLKIQAQVLLDFVQNPDKARKDLQRFQTQYRDQDLSGLAAAFSEDPFLRPYEAVLLGDRNRRWVPKMLRVAKVKPTFFAVDAGNLGGKDGVIALLRRSGYKVRAVPQK
jgi:uncharacterized protein